MDYEAYWAEFYADVQAYLRELRERRDPDGEMDLLELIEAEVEAEAGLVPVEVEK